MSYGTTGHLSRGERPGRVPDVARVGLVEALHIERSEVGGAS